MLLAIDAGNTNLVFALVEPGRGPGQAAEIRTRWRIATDPRRTADEYAVWLHQLLAMEGFTRADVDAVIIGTVVPRGLHNLHVLSTKYFGVEPIVAGQGGSGWGVELDVVEPRSVGADRVLNVIAAHALFGGDLIVGRFRHRPPPSTWSIIAAPIKAGSSRRASTCRSTPWSAPPPSCRASRSSRPPPHR
jgi:type III pantothenate kinase